MEVSFTRVDEGDVTVSDSEDFSQEVETVGDQLLDFLGDYIDTEEAGEFAEHIAGEVQEYAESVLN